MKAPVPQNEGERLAALHRYSILDTLPERDFDDLAALAAHVCGTPIALVTLVDANRLQCKAKVGLTAALTSWDIAFCAHAIVQSDLLVVPDAMLDEKFADDPGVTSPPHIRFSASALLVIPDGYALETLCVIDDVPRQWTRDLVEALRVLSRQVLAQLVLRRSRTDLANTTAQSAERAKRSRMLLEINNVIITNLTQNELLHAVCEALKRVVSFERVALTLYEPELDVLRMVAYEGPFRSEYFRTGKSQL